MPDWYPSYDPDARHGTAMASIVVGSTIGVARKATIVPVETGAHRHIPHTMIHGFMLILDELRANPDYIPKSVISCSWNTRETRHQPAFIRVFSEFEPPGGEDEEFRSRF